MFANGDTVHRNQHGALIAKERATSIRYLVEEANKRGQPVLVGTVSVESSEVLSRMLKRTGVIHAVLNAKFHQQEAEIVSCAGQLGAVTVSTNMALRNELSRIDWLASRASFFCASNPGTTSTSSAPKGTATNGPPMNQ